MMLLKNSKARRPRKPKPPTSGVSRQDVFEEQEHPRGPGGRFANKPGDGNQSQGGQGGRPLSSSGRRPRTRAEVRKRKARRKARRFLEKWVDEGKTQEQYVALKGKMKDWVDNPQKHKIINGIYRSTQKKLKASGVNSVEIYRGMSLSPDHPIAKAIKDGKIKTGTSFEIAGLKVSSWSERHDNARAFAMMRGGEHDIGIIIKSEIPASDVIISHRTQKTLDEMQEHEFVVKNTGTRKVTLFKVVD